MDSRNISGDRNRPNRLPRQVRLYAVSQEPKTGLHGAGAFAPSAVALTEALDYRPETPDERAALGQALRDRADLRNADLAVKLREQAVAVARSDYFPRIEAYFSETYARPDPLVSGVDAWGDSWRAGSP